ncbi:MAG: zinc dependent phospholipase C family protein [Chloroflexota bacterium]
MPTPFYHLSIGEELLAPGKLPEHTRRCLLRYRAAFLLGNTAPDVQTISHQSRQSTHFYALPLDANTQEPWAALWEVHPELSRVGLFDAQAAFLAGYLCHLQADWLWVKDIFEPVFGKSAKWGMLQERLYIHNVLRAAIDRDVLEELDPLVGDALQQATPQNWLPFVEDVYLCRWRDFLTEQLGPGAAAQTVEVFAARQGIPVEAFYRLLDSERLMAQQVFSHFSRLQIEAYRRQVIAENVSLLAHWLPNCRATARSPRRGYTSPLHGESA